MKFDCNDEKDVLMDDVDDDMTAGIKLRDRPRVL